MKLDPGFLNHWKTERLIEQLGADGVLAVLRLWGNAQIRREFSGLTLTPRRLAMETKWKGDENHLFSVLTDPDAPWIDANDDGTFSIHGFSEHQHQVVKLWENGKKGGRPRKVSPTPSSKEDSSSYSYSSPICEPNGNQMVFDAKKPPTIQEAITAGSQIMMTKEQVETWWHKRDADGWTIHRNNGRQTPITNWRKDLAASKAWAAMSGSKDKPQAPRKRNFTSDDVGI